MTNTVMLMILWFFPSGIVFYPSIKYFINLPVYKSIDKKCKAKSSEKVKRDALI